MIKMELSESDLGKLVRIGRDLSGVEVLDKVSNFRLLPDNLLSFDQSFKLSTTVQVRLSRGPEGELLIDIVRLADNSIGNIILRLSESKITEFIENETHGILKKESDNRLSLNLATFLHANVKVENVGISNQKLSLDISLE